MTAFRELFTPHGSFTIEIGKQRMLVDAIGPFNLESISQYQRAIADAINVLKQKRWTQIVVLHGMSMMTPEAEEQLEKVVRYRMERGLCASVIVVGDVEGKGIVKQQLQRVYGKTQLLHTFTETIEEAHHWLSSMEKSHDILEA
jgi:protoheme ferro-lyase